MTTDEKSIKPKLGLLKRAQKLDNVSQACKVLDYSRYDFYHFETFTLILDLVLAE